MSTPAQQRALAAQLLTQVVTRGRTTDQATAGRKVPPLARELLFGCLRHYVSLDRTITAALDRPVKPKDEDLRCLMIVGAYQLRHLRVPDHAAIHETVEACRTLGKPWARGLVNAVLRRCARAPEAAEPSFEHPAWLEERLRQDYDDADAILDANNGRAPMTIRINLARTTPEAYLATLEMAGIETRAPREDLSPDPNDRSDAADGAPRRLVAFGPETRVLDTPLPAAELPGHAAGEVAVQDAGAQLAAPLLAPGPGARVIDACAAPGGKLFHLLERCPGIRGLALEVHAGRLETLRAEAARLGHDVAAIAADATDLGWWDGEPAAAVLIDAPCSGTGTLRRHPDIKLLRRPDDIAAAAALQHRLLANLWQVLAPGGTLLYCTCSILAAENDDIVADFLARHDDAVPDAFRLPAGRATRHGWQLLPTNPDTDGFYYSRMTKARA